MQRNSIYKHISYKKVAFSFQADLSALHAENSHRNNVLDPLSDSIFILQVITSRSLSKKWRCHESLNKENETARIIFIIKSTWSPKKRA